MVRFLSPEWIDALDRAAGSVGPVSARDVRLTVQQRVHDGPDDVSWHVRVDDGRIRILPGETDDADVTFEQDRETAVAVATGKLSAQAAFIDGRLRVRGDLPRLARHRETLAGLDQALVGVRDTTTY